MNRILSRILGWLGFSVQNTYEGARWTGDRSWIPESVQSARLDINSASRFELLRKSRYFEKNSGLYNRLADIWECYVAGGGLQVTPASSDPSFNTAIKPRWDEWTRYCDLTSRQEFGTLQSLLARAWFVDGEVFVLLTSGDTKRPRIQLIESHRVSTPPQFAAQEGISIIDGIRINPAGRPISYFISDDGREPKWTEVNADFVVHLFEPSRPGQYRGIPFISPVLNDLHDLDDLEILEMRAARDGGEKSVFITTESGELPTGAELWRRRASTGTQTATGTATTENLTEYYKKSVGGRTVALRKGEDVKQFAPSRPTVVTMEYWKQKQAKICAGVGIPYVLVFSEQMQGTQYRGALDVADVFFKSRSAVLASAVRRIWEYVIGYEVKIDKTLNAPNDWYLISIQSPRSVNVDVGRNSAAMLAELAAGATNYERIYGPLGLDWRDEFRRLAEQQRFAREIGLELQVGNKPSEPSTTKENETQDPEGDADPLPQKEDE